MVSKPILDRVRILYNYSSSHLSKTELVKFYYALKGRDGQSGILSATHTEFLAKSVLLCSKKADDEIRDFLEHWNCKYERKVLVTHAKNPSAALVNYSTKQLSSSELVRFYYALKGRDGISGILKQTETKQLARAVLFISATQIAELEDFFALWNIPIDKREVRELNV